MSKQKETLPPWQIATPLGFPVRVAFSYWQFIITVKHPVMKGCEAIVQETLKTPDEIRRSKSDPSVHLFYRKQKDRRWICAVAKKTQDGGFLITAYPTDTIKEGEKIWPM